MLGALAGGTEMTEAALEIIECMSQLYLRYYLQFSCSTRLVNCCSVVREGVTAKQPYLPRLTGQLWTNIDQYLEQKDDNNQQFTICEITGTITDMNDTEIPKEDRHFMMYS